MIDERVGTVTVTGIDPALVLSPLRMLRADPTIHVGHHVITRSTWTPQGPGVVSITWGVDPGRIDVRCEGDGAAWLVARSRGLLGVDDDVSSFQPLGIVGRLWAQFGGDRVGATGTVWHDLAWTITQQRVRRADAAGQWRRLVHRYGERLDRDDALHTPPDPERLARVAPWALRSLGIDERRASILIASARVSARLNALADSAFSDAAGALRSLPGIGPWTLACMSALTWGERDTVIPGDSGIPSLVAQVLAGERRADDPRMLELLEPYRPHRYRVLRLALAARSGRGPRPSVM